MAINAYTGLMGSGKTYEVVASVIVPAIKTGRNVVTNIRGLNHDAICKHLGKPADGVAAFGKIRQVKNDEIQDDDFFPKFVDEKFVVLPETIVQPGDLVAIDEAWRPWGNDSKCVKSHMSFFREHRQCVTEAGMSCDLVVLSQDITDIHKLLKNVIEMSFLFTKLKTLGLSKRYRVEVYEGSKLYKTKLTSRTVSKYNKAIFPLYKSYASESGAGVEKVVDARQNMLKQGAFFVPLLIAVGMMAYAAWWLWGYFHPAPPVAVKPSVVAPAAVSGVLPGVPDLVVPPSAGVSVAENGAGSISGSVTVGGEDWVVLTTPDGLRVVSPSMVYSRGLSAVTKDSRKLIPAYLNHE